MSWFIRPKSWHRLKWCCLIVKASWLYLFAFFFWSVKRAGRKKLGLWRQHRQVTLAHQGSLKPWPWTHSLNTAQLAKKKQERKKCPNRTWLIRPRGFMPFTFSPRTFYTPSSRLHLRPSCSVKWTPQNRRNLEFTLLLLCFIGGRWVVEFRLSYVLWFVSEGLVHGFEILQLGRHLLCLLRGFRRPGYERNGKNE